MNFSAVILAGGASRRMGRDKAEIVMRGESLLARAVRAARRAGAGEVFISGRRGGDYPDADCPVLFDVKPGGGPLGGIERALSVMTFPVLLVLAVDLPRVTPALLRKLVSQCAADTGVVPRCRGELEPLAAFYPKRCLALVRTALARRRLAARDFAETCLRSGAVREFHVLPRDQIRFANWNSPGDLPVTARSGRIGGRVRRAE